MKDNKGQNPSQNLLSSVCPIRPHGLCQSKRKARHDYFTALPDPLGLTGEHLLFSPQQLHFLASENHTWLLFHLCCIYIDSKKKTPKKYNSEIKLMQLQSRVKCKSKKYVRIQTPLVVHWF